MGRHLTGLSPTLLVRKELLTIRKAELRNVPELHRLINHYAAEHLLCLVL